MAEKKTKQTTTDLSGGELLQAVQNAEHELFELKMKKATGQLENTASLWSKRKFLARLKTRVTMLEKDSVKA